MKLKSADEKRKKRRAKTPGKQRQAKDPPGPTRVSATLATSGDPDRDAATVRELVAAGVVGLCVDASHGEAEDWQRLVESARRESKRQERPIQAMVALAGSKIETGALVKGSAVLRWEPRRNQLGKLLRPARLWLTAEHRIEAALQPVEAILPVSNKLLRKAQTEDTVRLEDARGRRRELRIRGAGRSGCLAECLQTTYVEAGSALHLERQGKAIAKGHVGALPRVERPLLVVPGDPLIVTREQLAGRPAVRDGGFLRRPARISTTAPAILDRIRPGERIMIGDPIADDGVIVGVVESTHDQELRIRVTRARRSQGGLAAEAGGSRIRSGSTIRFPDSALDLPVLSPHEEPAVAFAARFADSVLLPSVERQEDVLELGEALDRHGGENVRVILAIASRRGVDALPRLLPAARRRPSAEILVALGSLEVEYGSTRLGEALLEILRQAALAHVPVLCSNLVLDHMARRGILHPSEVRHAAAETCGDGVVIGPGRDQLELVRRLVEQPS